VPVVQEEHERKETGEEQSGESSKDEICDPIILPTRRESLSINDLPEMYQSTFHGLYERIVKKSAVSEFLDNLRHARYQVRDGLADAVPATGLWMCKAT
jgi:hypothetical protein